MKILKIIAFVAILGSTVCINYIRNESIDISNLTLTALANPTPVGGEYSAWDKLASGTNTKVIYQNQGATINVQGISYNAATSTWSLGGGSFNYQTSGPKGFLTDCSASGVYCGQDYPSYTPI